MASVQRLRTATPETQLLPSVVVTEQQSLLVVKKLLAIAVSCITYLRGLFPEKAYGVKFVEEQQVMILREEHSCPGAKQIVQWMHGCFDALQKKYLRMVCLSIYTDPENPQKVTECYRFKIQYTEAGPQMDFESNNKVSKMSGGNMKKSSILLVRKLYTLMQNLGPLPDSVCLSMALSYYDNVTPKEYEPPGFKEGSDAGITFEKDRVKLIIGEVVSPFHILKVDVTTERQRLEQIDDTEPITFGDRPAVKMSKKEVVSKTTTHQQTAGGMVRDVASEEVTTRTTRSGRITRSVEKKPVAPKPPKENKETKAVHNQKMSQLESPLSQDFQPTRPKKMKLSHSK